MEKKNAGVREKLVLLAARAQLNGSKTARPIVAVHHFRCNAQASEQGNRHAAKEGEPFEVIPFAVNLATIEIVWRVD